VTPHFISPRRIEPCPPAPAAASTVPALLLHSFTRPPLLPPQRLLSSRLGALAAAANAPGAALRQFSCRPSPGRLMPPPPAPLRRTPPQLGGYSVPAPPPAAAATRRRSAREPSPKRTQTPPPGTTCPLPSPLLRPTLITSAGAYPAVPRSFVIATAVAVLLRLLPLASLLFLPPDTALY